MIVIDMYGPYISLIKSMFKNATIVFDRFHIIQKINRAVNKICIDIMNTYSKHSKEYKVLKQYWRFILKNDEDIDATEFKYFVHFKEHKREYDILQFMLHSSDELSKAYQFLQLFKIKAQTNQIEQLFNSIDDMSLFSSRLVSFIIQMKTNQTNIINAYATNHNNGCIESCIQKIKLLKRNAYGFKTFYNFKLRIMLVSYNYQQYLKIKAAKVSISSSNLIF